MTSRSTSSKRGASRSASAKKKSKINIPGWIWLLTGFASGFFIAFLMGLTPAAVDVRTVTGNNSEKDPSQKVNKPVFDFYTLLPESEVKVDVEPVPVDRKQRQPEIESKTTQAKPRVQPKAKPQIFLLQAGSFRNVKDAERLRAQLLLEGLNPKIEKVGVGGGENWFRVQLGPFDDQHSLKTTRSTLAGMNIDSLLLQVK